MCTVGVRPRAEAMGFNCFRRCLYCSNRGLFTNGTEIECWFFSFRSRVQAACFVHVNESWGETSGSCLLGTYRRPDRKKTYRAFYGHSRTPEHGYTAVRF